MTTFKIFTSKFPKLLEQALEDIGEASNMQKIGDELATEIKVRTRSGKGVDKNEGKSYRFDPLQPSTIKTRGYGRLSPKTTKKKSNLTQTGDMVKSIHAKGSTNKVKIKVDADQKIKVKYVSKQRPFLHISKIQIKRMVKKMKAQIVKDIESLINSKL